MIEIIALALLGLVVLAWGVLCFNRNAGSLCAYHPSLHGKTAIITGSTSGMGKATARELARLGCCVVIASRDEKKCLETANEIAKETANPNVIPMPLDLRDLRDVERFAELVTLRFPAGIDLLINNAAVMADDKCPVTKQGFEVHFGVNYLAHFHLTTLLLPLLRRASGRIVNCASVCHWAFFRFPIPESFVCGTLASSWSWLSKYAQSKLCVMLFTKELSHRARSVTTVSVDAGAVATNLTRHLPRILKWLYDHVPVYRPPEIGCQCAVFAAVAPKSLLVSGGYYSNFSPAICSKYAADSKAASELWDLSALLVTSSIP